MASMISLPSPVTPTYLYNLLATYEQFQILQGELEVYIETACALQSQVIRSSLSKNQLAKYKHAANQSLIQTRSDIKKIEHLITRLKRGKEICQILYN